MKEVNFEKRGKLSDHVTCPLTGECVCVCYHCKPAKILTAIILVLFLFLPTLSAAQPVIPEINYTIEVLEQKWLKDINKRGDLIADPPSGSVLIPGKGKQGPIPINCPGSAAWATLPSKLTNNQAVGGSCQDTNLGFVRYRNGQYAFVNFHGALLTDVYALTDTTACGQFFGNDGLGLGSWHGFCLDLVTNVYEQLDFPVLYGGTVILGVTESGLKIGAYFTFDPATNFPSEWAFFTLLGGQFSPLSYPLASSSWSYPLDANKFDDILLLFDNTLSEHRGPGEPFSTGYGLYSDGRYFQVSLPSVVDGHIISYYDLNGMNDQGQLTGEVQWSEPCTLPPPQSCCCPPQRRGIIATPIQEKVVKR